jgi:hypothetical protein
VEELLKGLAKNKIFVEKCKDSCEGNWHKLLHIPKVDCNAQKYISLGWKNVEYWMEATRDIETVDGSVSDARCDNKYWIQAINLKILFFSNMKEIYQILEKKKK